MKFSKNTFNDDSLKKIAALIKVYIERGGCSDYFCRLTPEMQVEILLRTEHEI